MKRILLVFSFTTLSVLVNLAAPALPDSVLSLQKAKERLIRKNLVLLSSYYDIDIAEAKVIQAKVWNNPYFIWNQELYNSEKNQFLNYKNQYMVQIEEVFSIAGKHTNTVKLAKISLEISKVQLQDVLRSLLFDLGTNYNNLAALQAKEILYRSVMTSYDRLIAATREQLKVGSISLSEALRLESEYKSVKTQALQNANEKERALSQLRILLQYPADTTVKVEQNVPAFLPNIQYDSMASRAVEIRPDLKVMKLTQTFNERNIKLQKSIAVPDVKIGYQPIDLASNYIRNFSGLNLEFPLPFFDRNQGRIQEAKFTLLQSQYDLQFKKNTVQNEVTAAINRYKQTNEGIAAYTPDFLQQLRDLNQNVNQNFQRRNITLLEFIDQQRIFISTNLQLIDLKQQYLDSVNELNFSVGTQIIEN